MSADVVISDRFLEQYQPVLKTLMACGYQNKLPTQKLTRIKKVSERSYAMSCWGQVVAGTLTPGLFWKVLKKSTISKHFICSN